MPEETPLISVVISTRDRGDLIERAVSTALESIYPAVQVIVADQSSGPATKERLRTLAADPRVRYVPAAGIGVSAGRNAAIARADGDIVFVTDDDCEVDPEALQRLSRLLLSDARIGIVFGNVVAGPHDVNLGFIPAYRRESPVVAHGIHEKHKVEGLSACMGLRKSVWKRLSGFDEMLGSGAPLRSGAETDFTIRALLAGFAVLEDPEVRVTHNGFRTWKEGFELIARYWFGTGAALAKQLKCGCWPIVPYLARMAGRWVMGTRTGVGVSLGRTSRWLRLSSFLRGIAAGFRAPLDRDSMLYRDGR